MFSRIDLRLKPSRLWRGWRLLVHAVALLAIWLAALSPFLQWLFSLLLVMSLLYSFIGPSERIERLVWQAAEGDLRLLGRHGWLQVTEIRALLASRWLIYMQLRVAERLLPLPLLVWRDSVDADGFRRLSVLARHAKPPQDSC
ncbi:protein YgfX [Marinobacterium arenosum]|uniref:protein YgfX n=1 Tax=Marinobacterium arenosum TaxID=2862496 RepID=UPI001C96C60B|nr:protein YgfX [Marinobacterium arenosum]MBY4676778.1 hypothetical protein [Marinobacterium arenosum]